ncbi:MAG: S8 family serine peptidase [Acidobacteriota bacterium]|nr:S8 family serine peptidase [Acidobacteriota bacterium]
MKPRADFLIEKVHKIFLALVIVGVICLQAALAAATLAPKLQTQVAALADNASVGVVIVTFNTSNGLNDSHLNLLRSLGINDGVTFENLGMVGAVLNAGQVRALAANPSVRSIWSNDRLQYHMNHARMITGVDRIRTDRGFQLRNNNFPVTGKGDFSVLVIDSGIDATHPDLQFGTKVIQNTQRVVSTDSGNTGITIAGVPLNGLTPSVSIENVPNTDNVGHGTHCAGIVGGFGTRSGGAYAGVAPDVKIVGSGGGVVIVVLDALAGWEYGFEKQGTYNIRVITNSYGPIEPEDYNPDHPFSIASRKAFERNMTVLWSGSNDYVKDSLNAYAQEPTVIGVAAATKDGMVADFSSRGVPREERLNDDNPFNDNEAPTLAAPGSGRFFESSLSRYGFTTDIVSVRASTNLTSNGTWFPAPGADAELPLGMLPFYTQISGTSMATPFVAGVVALMLDADPSLTPEEIKQILVETTTKMPGYQDFEVGAGYLNAYAAVDKVFNRSKNYKNFSEAEFRVKFGEERPAVQPFHIDYDPAVSGPTSANARQFTVQSDMSVLEVRATVDTLAEVGTGNFVAMRITSPSGVRYSTAIDTPVIGSAVRELTVQNPEAGTWTVEFRGACGLAAVPQVCSPQQLASPGPIDGTVTQIKYILPNIADIANHQQRADIEFALKNRLIDIYADGNFYPNQAVTREDLARSLALNTHLRQSIASTPKFTDVSGELLRIAEAVTSKGSTLKDADFISTGMMSASGSLFNPAGSINRLDLAVALVKALGHDAEARAKANTNVTTGGVVISDNAQIPGALRGYIQVAIDKGLLETYPAELIQTGPGQYTALPGPRVEPTNTVSRAAFAAKLNKFRTLFTTGG